MSNASGWSGRPVWRPDPIIPVQGMQTYEIVSPINTHTRAATCHEVDCPNNARGWTTTVDVGTVLGAQQANYIRLKSGRSFTVEEVGTLVTFTFYPFQQCFADHRVPLGRPELFIKRGGDWRARTSEPVRMRPEDWVDDCQNNLADLVERQKRG